VRPVANVADVAPGTTKRVVIDGREILICNVDGSFFAIEDVCTHDGAPLDQGDLDGNCIVCPRHGAMFDVRTGDALTLPAVIPLSTYAVELKDGEILIG
jgi:3-phenylpropionate/trans-cinnamate dioxygenase ferredoxin component